MYPSPPNVDEEQKAICKLSCFKTAKAAKRAVKVVPMLAPNVIGSILCTLVDHTPRTFGTILISHCRYPIADPSQHIFVITSSNQFRASQLCKQTFQQKCVNKMICHGDSPCEIIQGTGSTPIPQSGVRAEVTTELLCTLGTWGLAARPFFEPRKKKKDGLTFHWILVVLEGSL